MPYNLCQKITNYLKEQGIEGARVQESIIVLPTETGEFHRRIVGVVTKDKLDLLIKEYKANQNVANV